MGKCLLPIRAILIEMILHSFLRLVIVDYIQLSLKRKYFELCQDVLQQDGLHIPLQQGPLPQSSRVLQSGPVIGVSGHGSKIINSNYL